MTAENSKRFKLIFLILYIAFALVLLVHAAMTGEASSTESSFVGRIVDRVLTFLFPDPSGLPLSERWEGFDVFVRKGIGHFGGFAFFGILGFFAFAFDKIKGMTFSLGGGLLVAILTECIQLFTEGRSGQISDVLLDFSGYLVGSVLLVLIFLFRFVKKR